MGIAVESKGRLEVQSEIKTGKRSGRIKLVLLVVVILGVITLSRQIDVQDIFAQALDRIQELGWIGFAVFALLYTVSTVFFLAPTVLTLGAGAAYGVVKGTMLVSVSSMLGASTAFLLGRYFARDVIAGRVEGNPRFKAIDDAVAREGWKIVGLTRLSPVFPFSLLNYTYGLTPVSFRAYFFASWIGMIPGTVMYVYLGKASGTVALIGAEDAGKSPGEWALLVIGLLATVAVTVFVTRLARKALADAVPENVEGDSPQEPTE